MKKIILLIACQFLIYNFSQAQTGQINGTVKDYSTKQVVPYATIMAFLNNNMVYSSISDSGGIFQAKNLLPGKYTLNVACIGYIPEKIEIVVTIDRISTIDVLLKQSLIKLNEVIVDGYRMQRIDHAAPSTQKTISNEEIQAMPTREINSMSCKVAGVTKTNKGSIRGCRSDVTTYYIDGIKVNGSPAINSEPNSEEYKKNIENEFFDVRHNPLSTFSIDVDGASYSNIRRFITQGTLPPPDAVRVEEMINYFNYNYPQPTDEHPFGITTEVSTCPWNTKHRLVQIGLNGKEIQTGNLPENNLVFLIDVSGSMSDENKLPLLRRSFHLLVNQMRKQDRVAIVVYAGNAGLVLPSTRGDEKEEILNAIDELESGGSTAGGAGIQLAYKIAKENFIKEGNNRVILATDGDFNVGVSNENDLISLIEEKRDDGIFLTVLGFGTGNYKDSKMELLADKGNGNYSYIDNIMEANKVFVKEMGATLNTIAKDVKLQIEFNPAKVKGYRLVGYENRMLADKDFNDDKKDAGELGSGKTVTAFYELIPATSDEKLNLVDSLKYQSVTMNSSAVNNELLTIKFRYKNPDGGKSKLIVHPVIDEQKDLNNSSDDFRFAAAVAEFGMFLSNSKFIGKVDCKDILKLASESKGVDASGYRAEFVKLVETAEVLQKETAGGMKR